MQKACAYCGKQGVKLTGDHVFPKSLYPASIRTTTNVPLLTIPACADCNNGWANDEAHFRNILAVSGDPNEAVNELWHSTIQRGFEQADAQKRLVDLWEQLHPVETDTGIRHAVHPASDPRFVRVLKKIIRGLHYHHQLWHPVPETMVEVDILRYLVPPEFEASLPNYHRVSEIVQYQFMSFKADDDTPMSSAWIFTFFENKRFIAWVQKQNDT